jgi:hypothetical protein
MKRLTNIIKQLPYAALILGICPLLLLWFNNVEQISAYAVLRSLIFSLAVMLMVILLSFILFRNAAKATLFSSCALLLFYAYGHLFNLIEEKSILGIVIGRHSILGGLWLILLAGGFVFIWRARRIPANIIRMLNHFSLILLIIVAGQVAWFQMNSGLRIAGIEHQPHAQTTHPSTTSGNYRDVYFIVLDSYTRDDLLAKEFNYDNSKFIQQLRDLDFVIPPCAQSNYSTTALSIASILNMDYIDALIGETPYETDDQELEILGDLLRHSLVREKFEAMGYNTVAFSSKADWLNMEDAAYFFDVSEDVPYLDRQETTNFHQMFLKTTAIRIASDTGMLRRLETTDLPLWLLRYFDPGINISDSRYAEYQQNLYSLQKLMAVPDLPGNKLVIAHLMTTHSSFVFNPDGSFREDPDDTREAYLNQITYANGQLIKIVKNILDKSSKPPVIILQADHSIMPYKERVKIFYALYLPDGGSEKAPVTMTPVNNFRLVFNTYFGEDYPLLEDESHFTDEETGETKVEPVICPAQ